MRNQITYVIVTFAIAAIVAGLSIIGLNQGASAQGPPSSEFPGQGQGNGPPSSEFPGQGQGNGPPFLRDPQGGPPSEFPGQGNGPPFLR
jgi:hypothetical protein